MGTGPRAVKGPLHNNTLEQSVIPNGVTTSEAHFLAES